jgi:hypothetical protein
MANNWNAIGWDEDRGQHLFTTATEVDEDGQWFDLCCPKCGCDHIVCDTPDLGNDAKCYECGHEFTITQNCWKLNPEMSEKYDT